jgi:hypothetical protein
MKYFSIVLIIFTISACEKPRDLKEEIMIIHDEVMPKTSQLLSLRNSLKKEISENSTNTEGFQMTIDSLKLAHDEMMEWMQQYDHTHDSSDTIYFHQQEKEISYVNQLYKQTILSAEQKLKK